MTARLWQVAYVGMRTAVVTLAGVGAASSSGNGHPKVALADLLVLSAFVCTPVLLPPSWLR